jgi:hypothetical protein
VRISDISVSRAHAFMRYNSLKDQITIEDGYSKFGTMVSVEEPIKVTEKICL